jgi:hypothetical protein
MKVFNITQLEQFQDPTIEIKLLDKEMFWEIFEQYFSRINFHSGASHMENINFILPYEHNGFERSEEIIIIELFFRDYQGKRFNVEVPCYGDSDVIRLLHIKLKGKEKVDNGILRVRIGNLKMKLLCDDIKESRKAERPDERERFAKGLAEGKAETTREMVLGMYRKGIDKSVIAEISQLSLEEVEKILVEVGAQKLA